jgi:hypothetical protein
MWMCPTCGCPLDDKTGEPSPARLSAAEWLQNRIDWHEIQATMADAADYAECVPFHDKQKAALEWELKQFAKAAQGAPHDL